MVAASADAFVWSGDDQGIGFRCTCTLHPDREAWFFRVEIENKTNRPLRCDTILLQDVGLATRGQVRNNELFTSQYIDHFAALQKGEENESAEPAKEKTPSIIDGLNPK